MYRIYIKRCMSYENILFCCIVLLFLLLVDVFCYDTKKKERCSFSLAHVGIYMDSLF